MSYPKYYASEFERTFGDELYEGECFIDDQWRYDLPIIKSSGEALCRQVASVLRKAGVKAMAITLPETYIHVERYLLLINNKSIGSVDDAELVDKILAFYGVEGY